MEVNPSRLQEGLQNYHAGVAQHLNVLQSKFEQLERRWQTFNATFEGTAADEFRSSWCRTIEDFRTHLAEMEKISALLRERLEYLQTLNQE